MNIWDLNHLCISKSFGNDKEDMKEDKNAKVTSISKARTLEEIADFWDTHSLDDHWDQTHEVEFELRVKHRPQWHRQNPGISGYKLK